MIASAAGSRATTDRPGRRLPRVLYAVALDASQKFGSLEEQIYLLAQAFRAEGSALVPAFLPAAGPRGGGLAAFDDAGMPTAELSLWKFRYSTVRRLGRLIAEHDIRLVHWNFYPPLNPFVWWLSVLHPRLSHYFTDHNSRVLPLAPPPRGLRRVLKQALLGRYRKVWGVSQYICDCLAEQRSYSNLECCPHFINTDRFRPDDGARRRVRGQFGADDHFVAVAVANLIPEKGIDVALRALAQCPQRIVLWVAGRGDEEPRLKALATELGVADRAVFFGQQANVEPLMQAADCLVCPSLWAEAAGLVNLEALSTGLPVLASRIGGIPEYVDDGVNGLLFPAGDHAALGSLLTRLSYASDECGRLGAAARTAAVQRFSPAARMDRYLDLYRSCP
jgi:glycosyltransferase involved in cell wall biosynthesis